ncbi:MAG: hypothetical protein E6Q68_06480 [Polynucleobacter sp.]|nr:MAG: hypothetical protein E6Q68_06480 [Polynucleobacter sp.]
MIDYFNIPRQPGQLDVFFSVQQIFKGLNCEVPDGWFNRPELEGIADKNPHVQMYMLNHFFTYWLTFIQETDEINTRPIRAMLQHDDAPSDWLARFEVVVAPVIGKYKQVWDHI